MASLGPGTQAFYAFVVLSLGPPEKVNPRTQERQEGRETPTGEPPEAE